VIVAATAAGVALALSLILTPLARGLARRLGITDTPDARRVHQHPTPRGGGIAVAAAVAAALALSCGAPSGPGLWVLAGGALLLAVGAVDDVVSLRVETKLAAQVVAAVLAVAGGLRFELLGLPALLEVGLTVVWIVLITNAFNLTDGLDGLVAGVAVIALLAFGGIVLHAGNAALAIPALALAGALVGFLAYNFHPATIFLGDSGSLLIGYALAVLTLTHPGARTVRPLVACLLVAVPATDTLLAIARRFLSCCLVQWGDGFFLRGIVEGLRNMVRADRRHIHHRLLDLGFSQRRAVLLLYAGAVSTSGLAYLVAGSPAWPVDLVALSLCMAVIAVVQTLGFDELRPARSGLFLPVLLRLARHRWLVVLTDFLLVALAYGGSLALVGGPQTRAASAAAAVGLMAGTQLATFAAFDVYRMAWWAAGVGDFGLLLRACAAGTIGGYMATRLLHLPAGGDSALVHFLLLLPAVTLMRFSHVLLLSQGARSGARRERALICGTGAEGRHALTRLRRDRSGVLEPIGFVEIHPDQQGRRLGSLPVLGTLDALGAIVRDRQVRHLVIADRSLRGRGLHWVSAVCRQLGVHVHRYVERLVPYDVLLARLRAAHDLATAWGILRDVFTATALQACVLAVIGPGPDPGPEAFTWQRAPGPRAGVPPALAAYTRSLADIAPQLDGRPTVFRRDGDGWLELAPALARPGDLIAVPVHCGDALWAVLLAIPRPDDGVMTPSDVVRLRCAARVLGRQAERWASANGGVPRHESPSRERERGGPQAG